MFTAIKGIIPLVSAVFMAVTANIGDTDNELYYYNLRFLKKAGPPRVMEMVKIENMTHKKPQSMKGVLVTYNNRDAKKAAIAGGFSNWKLVTMDRSKHGIWYYFVEADFLRKDYRYKLNVDGTWIMDPKNPNRADDGYGSYVSVFNNIHNDEGKYLTYLRKGNIIEFRIYNPHARLISIVGDFNNWNPESDLLEKDKKGVWRLEKRLSRGLYRYKYIIDGDWTVDLYNDDTASDGMGGICSLIRVN